MQADEKERIVEASVSALKAGAPVTPSPLRSPWLKAYPKNVDWFAELKPVALQSLLERSAAEFGSRICCDFFGRRFTYSEIDKLSNRLAKGLQKKGIKKGCNVGILMPNTPAYIIVYYAILKAGGTAVNFNPLHTVEELAYQAKDAHLDLMVTVDLAALFPKLESLLARDTIPSAAVCTFADMLPFWKSGLFKLTKKARSPIGAVRSNGTS